MSNHSEYPDKNVAELQILGLDLHLRFTILHDGWEMDNDGYITTDGNIYTTSHGGRLYEMSLEELDRKIAEAEDSLDGLRLARLILEEGISSPLQINTEYSRDLPEYVKARERILEWRERRTREPGIQISLRDAIKSYDFTPGELSHLRKLTGQGGAG